MEDRPPKVSVLALAYNQSEYLRETLDSIRAQTFQDFELLVSDDASQDDSAQQIQNWNAEHNRAERLFLHSENKGLCPTLNELLSCARGEYIQIIACDDHLLPTALEERVAVLDKSPERIGAVYSDAAMMDETGATQPTTFLGRFLKNKPIPEGDLFPRLLMGNFLPVLTVLARRSAMETAGRFDPDLAFEDWDMWQRLSRSHEFAFTPGPVARYRLHSQNMHRTLKQQSRQFYRILAKHRDFARARLRILLTIQRNPEDFQADSPELNDFISWADQYPDTRFFLNWYVRANRFTSSTVSHLVTMSEKFLRPFTRNSPRQQKAA